MLSVQASVIILKILEMRSNFLILPKDGLMINIS